MPLFVLDLQPQIQNSLNREFLTRSLEDGNFTVAHLRILNYLIAT